MEECRVFISPIKFFLFVAVLGILYILHKIKNFAIYQMKNFFSQWVHILFNLYTAFLFIRILISWVPDWYGTKWAQFIAFYTDPYLNFFRRLIPPLGGVLDLSPIVAFLALRLMEFFILNMI